MRSIFVLLTLTFPVAAEEVDFNRDVRPILSDACFTCHGPDQGHREADLRLDQQDGIFRSADGVTIVDPKSPENSELLRRILSSDPDEVMPPPGHARRLKKSEIQTIRQWIEQGAPWKGHWAYVRPHRPEVPDVSVSPTGNEIDRFLQQELDRRQLVPLGQADPATLVRRLSLDLTGLPPSPKTVREFQADPSPKKWRELIDRMLSSHHHAERMAVFWLDLVRYADTNGIHGDNHREVWMYRDWVLNAFQSNMPFDEFTIEQLAGDLLPNATDEQKIASGYNKLLLTTREGGAQPKEYLAKYSADRVRNVAGVWLGATMGCCECHDHKYDPYSISDFYSLAAFFADVRDVPVGVQPTVKMPSRQQKEQLAEYSRQIAELEKQLQTQTPELDEALHAWALQQQETLKNSGEVWNSVRVVDMKSDGGQTMTLLDDNSILTSGQNPPFDTYTIEIAPVEGHVTAVRLETLRHPSFFRKSLSRGNGNFVLSAASVTHLGPDAGAERSVAIGKVVASYEQKGWPAAAVLDNKRETGWAVDGHQSADRDPIAVFHFAEPIDVKEGDRLRIELQHTSVKLHNIGRFRLTTSAQPSPGMDDNPTGLPEELLSVVKAWPQVTPEQRQKLATLFRSTTPALEDVRQQLKQVQAAKQQLEKQIPETLITLTQPPREIRVLARGNWMDDSGPMVSPAVPHFLRQIRSPGRATRLDLARWLVSPENPLVARVFVNRLWKMYFGRGLVATADDFGSQGAWPTHPELLDWLATEFQQSGWDIQHMIRLIVQSDAYRRSSRASAELWEKDPFNKWLARQGTFRLDAEFIRDTALSVSGLLVDRVGGRSVKPYQPVGYWAHLNFPKRTWQPDVGENQYRRGVYTYWCRTFLHPAMRIFDAPTREECTVDRPRSNNALQALVLLNDPSYVEAARVLAARTLTEADSTTAKRIHFIFELCLCRPPREKELSVLTTLLRQAEAEYSKDSAAADALLNVGQAPVPERLDRTELAAWTSVARAVLNLHETVTRN